jgi:hypothetical protein
VACQIGRQARLEDRGGGQGQERADRAVQETAGATGFAPEQGVFSPDGKLLAVPVRTGPTWQLALVDVGPATATRVTGAAVQQDSVFVDWSA